MAKNKATGTFKSRKLERLCETTHGDNAPFKVVTKEFIRAATDVEILNHELTMYLQDRGSDLKFCLGCANPIEWKVKHKKRRK